MRNIGVSIGFFLLVCFLVKRMVDTFINVLNCAAYEFTFLT